MKTLKRNIVRRYLSVYLVSDFWFLSYKHNERQRWRQQQRQHQQPMLVYGDACEWVWDRFSSITTDQHWMLTLLLTLPSPLGVVIP